MALSYKHPITDKHCRVGPRLLRKLAMAIWLPLKARSEDPTLPSPLHPFHKDVLVLREDLLELRCKLYLQHLQRDHQGRLHGHATYAVTQGLALGLMLCCRHLENCI